MTGNTTALIGVLITWAGIVLYLIRLDRRLPRRKDSA
ncbi:MAG: CcmD family protein [Candidatus Zixiibacteriota bacterium]